MPTAARQKYLAKQAAKKADILSDTDRQAEYDKVMGQLTQISAPEVDKFEKLMLEWVKDAKVRQGVIPIPAIRRTLCYSLGISRSRTFVSLRSDEPDQMNTTHQQSRQAENLVPTNPVENSETNGDEDQIPDLVPVPSPSTTTPIDEHSTTPQSIVIQQQAQQEQRYKKKKKPVLTQPAHRGSRSAAASRPPPVMKPKAQST